MTHSNDKRTTINARIFDAFIITNNENVRINAMTRDEFNEFNDKFRCNACDECNYDMQCRELNAYHSDEIDDIVNDYLHAKNSTTRDVAKLRKFVDVNYECTFVIDANDIDDRVRNDDERIARHDESQFARFATMNVNELIEQLRYAYDMNDRVMRERDALNDAMNIDQCDHRQLIDATTRAFDINENERDVLNATFSRLNEHRETLQRVRDERDTLKRQTNAMHATINQLIHDVSNANDERESLRVQRDDVIKYVFNVTRERDVDRNERNDARHALNVVTRERDALRNTIDALNAYNDERDERERATRATIERTSMFVCINRETNRVCNDVDANDMNDAMQQFNAHAMYNVDDATHVIHRYDDAMNHDHVITHDNARAFIVESRFVAFDDAS